jgi:Tol biopolymer transport system component
MKTQLLFLLLGLLLGLAACNEEFIEPDGLIQYGSVNGQVLNKKDGKALPRAAVRLSPTGQTVLTDTLGRFRFDSVAAGKYTVQATKETFRDELTAVEVNVNRISVVVLHLVNENPTPTEPTLLAPAAGASAVPVNALLKWQASDPAKDPLTYEVALTREGSTTPQTFPNLKADSLVMKDLAYNTTYHWQVTVSDGVNSVTGKIGSFRTLPFPEVPYVFTRKVGGNYQLFAATDGGTPLQLTHEGSNWRPVVSPNRKEIAYISNAETDLHLFVMNLDGSNRRWVTTVPVAGLDPRDLSFCWSPDGTQLLYPSGYWLYAVRADGSGNGLRQVAQAVLGRQFAGCDWTPQGDRIIARLTGSTVYDNYFLLLNAQGQEPQYVYTRTGSRVSNPVFSVTGKDVLFAYDTAQYRNEQGRQLNSEIAVLTLPTAAKAASVQLVGAGNDGKSGKPAGTNDLEPRYAPDGAKIIFTNRSNTGTGSGTVCTMDRNGQNRTVLIPAAEMAYWR